MNGFYAYFEQAYEVCISALEALVFSGMAAGVLLVVVLAAQLVLRRRLSAGQWSVLWGLVLVRLMLPAVPASPFSLQNLWASSATEAASEFDSSGPYFLEVFADDGTPRPDLAAEACATLFPGATPMMTEPTNYSLLQFEVLLPLLWLSVGSLSVGVTLWRHFRFCHRVRQMPTCDDQRILENLNAACRRAKVRQPIAVLMSHDIEQPAVLGWWRPRLLLPLQATSWTDEQLQMVMLHELAHVRRWDIAANWLLVLVRAVHWWNPVYWFAAARYRNLVEQACDAYVLRTNDGTNANSYSELLLSLVAYQPSDRPWRVQLPASALGLFSHYLRMRVLKQRLRALPLACPVRGSWQIALAATLILCVMLTGFTDAWTVEPAPDNPVDWLPPTSRDIASDRTTAVQAQGPLETRCYDVSQILKRLDGKERTGEDGRFNMQQVLGYALRDPTTPSPIRSLGNVPRSTEPQTIPTFKNYKLEGTALLITATAEQHAEVSRLFAAWTEGGLSQNCIEARFVVSDQDLARQLGGTWNYLEAFAPEPFLANIVGTNSTQPAVRAQVTTSDYLPVVVMPLEAEQIKKLASSALAVLLAPKVTTFNGTEATILDGTQIPFVVGLRAHEESSEPKIAIVDEGLKVTMRAAEAADRNSLRIEARVESTKIGQVHAAPAGDEGWTIQIPQVKRCRVDVASQLKPGQCLLVGFIPDYEQKQFHYVLLTPKVLEETR